MCIKYLFCICKLSGTTINNPIQLSADPQSNSECTTANDFQELATEDHSVTCTELEHDSPCQSEDVTYLSSGEEQPHSSSSSPEQQFIPNSSTPESSVPHTVSMGSKISIDIGNIIKPSKSNDEMCLSVRRLGNSEKYFLLLQHVKPPTVLPATFSHGCNRKFYNDWLTKYPWLKYSPKLDAVFCGPCAVLLDDSQKDKGVLVNKPFFKMG